MNVNGLKSNFNYLMRNWRDFAASRKDPGDVIAAGEDVSSREATPEKERGEKCVCRTDYTVASILTCLLYIEQPARHINGRREEEKLLIFEWHFRPSISLVLSLKLTPRWIYMDVVRGNRCSVSGLCGNPCRNCIGYRNWALVSAVDTQRPYVKWTFIMTTDMFHRERTLEFNVAIRHVTHFCVYTSVRIYVGLRRPLSIPCRAI